MTWNLIPVASWEHEMLTGTKSSLTCVHLTVPEQQNFLNILVFFPCKVARNGYIKPLIPTFWQSHKPNIILSCTLNNFETTKSVTSRFFWPIRKSFKSLFLLFVFFHHKQSDWFRNSWNFKIRFVRIATRTRY